ncbi:MAG: hypothetical protein KY445_08220 [Armatimonadetes bacterium]|nr:hypothetical protein [Armatimonadota bacterium]
MKTLTPQEIRLRAFLTVGVAGLGFLATNDTWIGMVGKIGVMLTGLILVMMQAWRGFIDKSESQRDAQTPVPVTNVPGEPLEITEVAPESRPDLP